MASPRIVPLFYFGKHLYATRLGGCTRPAYSPQHRAVSQPCLVFARWQVVLGLLLTLLALVGFLFNFYILLALVLTKQVIVA
jgi:hypothetical protein